MLEVGAGEVTVQRSGSDLDLDLLCPTDLGLVWTWTSTGPGLDLDLDLDPPPGTWSAGSSEQIQWSAPAQLLLSTETARVLGVGGRDAPRVVHRRVLVHTTKTPSRSRSGTLAGSEDAHTAASGHPHPAASGHPRSAHCGQASAAASALARPAASGHRHTTVSGHRHTTACSHRRTAGPGHRHTAASGHRRTAGPGHTLAADFPACGHRVRGCRHRRVRASNRSLDHLVLDCDVISSRRGSRTQRSAPRFVEAEPPGSVRASTSTPICTAP